MLSGPVALALAAGMAATVNPCGFALLPAYLAMFIGGGDDTAERGRAASVSRAMVVSLILTAGFVAVFGLFGLVISPLAVQVERFLPWATILIGLGLVGLGVAFLRGRQVTLSTPKLARGGRDAGTTQVFLFGVSYAVASLSCTIGPFLAVTSTTLGSGGVGSGIGLFVAYALGMGLVVTALTVAAALARAGVATGLRRAMPYLSKVSGGLLVAAGAYVAWYGWFEIRTLGGDVSGDPIVERALEVQTRLQRLVSPDDPVRVAALLATALVVVGVVTRVLQRRRDSTRADTARGDTDDTAALRAEDATADGRSRPADPDAAADGAGIGRA